MILLDKSSERLLSLLIKEHSTVIDFITLDEELTGYSYNEIVRLCEHLQNLQFLKINSYSSGDSVKVTLCHKAHFYFDSKNTYLEEKDLESQKRNKIEQTSLRLHICEVVILALSLIANIILIFLQK